MSASPNTRATYLDLADTWRAAEIGPDTWRAVAEPPVRFQQASWHAAARRHMAAQDRLHVLVEGKKRPEIPRDNAKWMAHISPKEARWYVFRAGTPALRANGLVSGLSGLRPGDATESCAVLRRFLRRFSLSLFLYPHPPPPPNSARCAGDRAIRGGGSRCRRGGRRRSRWKALTATPGSELNLLVRGRD